MPDQCVQWKPQHIRALIFCKALAYMRIAIGPHECAASDPSPTQEHGAQCIVPDPDVWVCAGRVKPKVVYTHLHEFVWVHPCMQSNPSSIYIWKTSPCICQARLFK